jgi:hypothetical protein
MSARRARSWSVIRSLLAGAGLWSCASQEPPDTTCLDGVIGRSVSIRPLEAERIEARLEALEKTNELRAVAMERLFVEAGCADHLQRLPVAGSRLPNLVCSLPGRSERRIVVGAHYDKIGAGEGAADNWSGAALLASLYESLRHAERDHGYDFIAFSDEEKGLVGSRDYVKQLAKDERARIAAMVNLDTLGLGATNVEVRVSSRRLLCYFEAAMGLLAVPARAVDADRVGTSDFAPFRRAGIPVLSVHSITQQTLSVLHSDEDRLAALDRPAYYQSYRLLAAYLALLDLGLAQESQGRARPAPGA